MMQHNQVFVIQVSSGSKPQLALPAPPEALLPSEVKYSASLVRGLGFTHLVLAAVLFALGILGSWVEPETCWSGAGVWAGLTTSFCGFSGLLAHRLWYKNFTIKTFLVSSVASVIINVLALILIIYAIINRYKHFLILLEQLDQYPWFQPYDMNREHRLTLSVSANLVVGFILEVLVGMWSVKVGWRGVHAPDFTANAQSEDIEEQQSVTSLPRHGQQVPLAALYQLLQTHPELLGSKNVMGGMGTPWEEHPSHRSMDYHERVNRFLSHAIQDQSHSFPRSLSTVPTEPSPEGSSSGGRGSPADTLPILPDHTKTPKQSSHLIPVHNTQSESKKRQSNSELLRLIRNENKAKAPAPKLGDKTKADTNSNTADIKNKNEAKTKTDVKRDSITEPKINSESKTKAEESNKRDQHKSPSCENRQIAMNASENEQKPQALKNNKDSSNKETVCKENDGDAQTSKLNDRNKESINSVKNDLISVTPEADKAITNTERKLDSPSGDKQMPDRKPDAPSKSKHISEGKSDTPSENKQISERKPDDPSEKQTPKRKPDAPSENKPIPERKPHAPSENKPIPNRKPEALSKNKPMSEIKPEALSENKPMSEIKPEALSEYTVMPNPHKNDNTESTVSLDQLVLLTDIQPPCEFQDT